MFYLYGRKMKIYGLIRLKFWSCCVSMYPLSAPTALYERFLLFIHTHAHLSRRCLHKRVQYYLSILVLVQWRGGGCPFGPPKRQPMILYGQTSYFKGSLVDASHCWAYYSCSCSFLIRGPLHSLSSMPFLPCTIASVILLLSPLQCSPSCSCLVQS